MKKYIPSRGDIIWLHVDPSTGKEIKGHHMAVVVSHKVLNEKTGRAIVCPITSKVKDGRPLDVVLPEAVTGKKSAIIPDQIKSIDFEKRGSEFAVNCPSEYLDRTLQIIFACIGGK